MSRAVHIHSSQPNSGSFLPARPCLWACMYLSDLLPPHILPHHLCPNLTPWLGAPPKASALISLHGDTPAPPLRLITNTLLLLPAYYYYYYYYYSGPPTQAQQSHPTMDPPSMHPADPRIHHPCIHGSTTTHLLDPWIHHHPPAGSTDPPPPTCWIHGSTLIHPLDPWIHNHPPAGSTFPVACFASHQSWSQVSQWYRRHPRLRTLGSHPTVTHKESREQQPHRPWHANTFAHAVKYTI